MFQRQPILYNPQGLPPPPPAKESLESLDAEQKQQESKPVPWWKTWITQNKIGLIASLVIFAVVAFVVPKLHTMPRFAAGGALPRYVLGAISVAGGSMISAINFAV
jgi:hypothetical protein